MDNSIAWIKVRIDHTNRDRMGGHQSTVCILKKADRRKQRRDHAKVTAQVIKEYYDDIHYDILDSIDPNKAEKAAYEQDWIDELAEREEREYLAELEREKEDYYNSQFYYYDYYDPYEYRYDNPRDHYRISASDAGKTINQLLDEIEGGNY